MSERTGPLPRALAPLTYLAARAYRIGWRIDVHRQLLGGAARLEVPVISVGNLTVGGTGKTPICSHLARSLQQAGARPAIALRGYRADRTGGSDEAAEYRLRHPRLPLLVGADRIGIARKMLHDDPRSFNVLILDDGFQHRRIHRDLDIVLVDAMRPGLDGDLLPNGWLREPPRSLQRADAVVITRADDSIQRVEDLVLHHRGRPADAVCRHVWSAIDRYHLGRFDGTIEPGKLAGKRVVVCTGLGNPDHFVHQVEAAGMTITRHLRFPDHVHYGASEMTSILSAVRAAEGVLTSAKDWVKLEKCQTIGEIDIPFLVPRLKIEFDRGADTLATGILNASGCAVVL